MEILWPLIKYPPRPEKDPLIGRSLKEKKRKKKQTEIKKPREFFQEIDLLLSCQTSS